MKLAGARALITGGAGGIGGAIAAELLERGAAVLLADRDAAALARTAARLGGGARGVETLQVDLARTDDLARLADAARGFRGGIDVLVNAAGVNHFGLFEDQLAGQVATALAINVQAPLVLVQLMLPHLRQQPAAAILNIGSVFGNIGYPGYATYSATKFAVRGFTEALRRELADTRVEVCYLAPRATRTGINGPAVEQMNAELKVAMDDPEVVARAACDLIAAGGPAAVVGWPEKFFAWLNAAFPGLVDGALARQLPVIRRYAGEHRQGTARGGPAHESNQLQRHAS